MFFLACSEQVVNEDDLVSNISISKTELLANGADVSTVKVFFNKDAKVSLIKLEVEVNNGTIIENGTKKIELVPEENLEGEISAEFNLRSSTIVADHVIDFKVDKYLLERTIVSNRSNPASVAISSSAFSVQNNFDSEITLEALLSNENGGKVSNGIKARFVDTFLDGTPVNGRFRQESLSSNSDSKVSAVYSPGLIEPNQNIMVTVELLDDSGNPIGISGSIEIYVDEID